MKKLVLGLAATSMLLVGFTASSQTMSQTKVIVKQRPVVITKQGTTYIVPAGTAASTTYFSYADDNRRYVCTYVDTPELVNIEAMPLSVKIGDAPRDVRCYPETNFTIEAQ